MKNFKARIRAASTVLGNTGGINYLIEIEKAIEYLFSKVNFLISSKKDLGWWNIADKTYTFENPQNINAGIRSKLIINTDNIIDRYSPEGTDASTIYDSSNNIITPYSVGDSYIFRISMTANPSLNNRNFTIDLDIGGTQNIIWERTSRLARGAGVDTKISMTNSIFVLDTFVANGGELYITCDGDVEIFDISLFIQKVTSA